MTHVLLVRLDSEGDVLLTGPAVRAVAADSARVSFLAGPRGAAAAALLPGVDEVMTFRAPWIDPEPPPVDRAKVERLVQELSKRGIDEAAILTSFHQNALPTALVLRLAGVGRIAAISEDYPGSLLDIRHRVDEMRDVHEVERALELVGTLGYRLPEDDDGRLAVRRTAPSPSRWEAERPYVVVHPGASVPARAWGADRNAELVRALAARGRQVVVTGGGAETELTSIVAGDQVDLGGKTGLAELSEVLAGADAVVVGNTGPAHLAAAVGTPVVSLFAPVVPAERWRPWRVPHVLLGDQNAPCRGSRARECPVAGHPCLASVTVDDVLDALEQLVPTLEVAA